MGRSRQQKKKMKTTNLQKCDRRRHNNQQPPETLPPANEAVAETSDVGPTRFFGCYLLSSLSPRHKGHSYIGFTVNPKRRIRQHNGEITSGAYKTKRKRPWEMVLCIHGFPTQVAALQFEWAWQHPKESLAVREAASTFKTLGGLANKIKLALTMLTLPSWKSMDLTVSFFSTKYMNHTAGCPTLPRQMKLHFCSMDELPCYWRGDHPYGCDDEDDMDSNHTEDFDQLVDDTQVSSIDTDFTIQNVNGSIWTWDERDLDSPLERESSTLVGADTVEEDEHILQSPLTDVHTENKTKEMSTQELIESSIDGIDHFGKESSSQPFNQIDSSPGKESASHHVLEEQRSVDLSREFPAGDCGKEMWTEEQRDSSPLLEDLRVPFDKVGTSEQESSSLVLDKFDKKDDMTYVLIDESTNEQRYPTYEQLPVRVRGDAVWASSMEGIEVIDLFTPSPECRLISGSKKRRVTRDSTDIIDLTRSPLFVQL